MKKSVLCKNYDFWPNIRNLSLRVLKRLGFSPTFVRRARYFRANLSAEDCYAPSRVLQDWKQERYFHSDILNIIRKVSATRFISLIFKIRFISTVYKSKLTLEVPNTIKVVRDGEQFSRKRGSLGKCIDKHIFYSNRSWSY
jgi:hypothetical protein